MQYYCSAAGSLCADMPDCSEEACFGYLENHSFKEECEMKFNRVVIGSVAFAALLTLAGSAFAQVVQSIQTPVVPPPGSSIVLQNGSNFRSGDGRFQLRIEQNGVVRLVQGSQVLWTAPNSSPRLQPTGIPNVSFVTQGCVLQFQSDGNLVLLGAQGVLGAAVNGCQLVGYDPARMGVMWSSKTYGNTGATLDVQNDGNVVIKNTSNRVVWTTNTCCR